ncbi:MULTISPECIES: DUF1302 family protein [Pseudomonas]|uniref:DUF1302 family protein n=1 Tax=Pseudomonas TaxID=286 RepID=UPI001E3302E5|nr:MULTISPECIES: DUF1302 family protein [Pseudomonas]MCE1114608.1 hypothetical protein [Pseudomonas sp. NMI795_08]
MSRLAVVLSAVLGANAAQAQLSVDPSLLLDTRQAVDREGHWALEEFSTQMGLALNGDGPWRFKTLWRGVSERRLDDHFERLEARELFAAYDGERCSHALGVQQVVWGSADRLRLLDVIHPFDRREGYFGDYLQQRRPLAMLNSECQLNDDQALQLLVVPQTREDLVPGPDARFAAFRAKDHLGQSTVTQGRDPDWRDPSQWSAGVRWSSHTAGMDLTLNGWHGWQDEDTYRANLDGGRLGYRRERERRTLLGGSIAAPVGAVVLKAEAAYTPQIYRYVRDPRGFLDVREADQKQLMLGMDYLAGDWFYGVQYYNQWRGGVDNALDQQRMELLSLAVRRELLQGRLALTSYLAQDLRLNSQYLAVEARLDLDAHWQLRTGIDWFAGDSASFGYYDAQSRWVTGVRYAF